MTRRSTSLLDTLGMAPTAHDPLIEPEHPNTRTPEQSGTRTPDHVPASMPLRRGDRAGLTIELDPDLKRRAKLYAFQQGTTVSALVRDALERIVP